MRRRKSPQEKKRLSLGKDRRNAFGENDKASRTAIPRRKASVNRANRRGDSTALAGAVGVPDEAVDAEIEQRLLGRRRKVWRKWPDQPLGEAIERKADCAIDGAPSESDR